MLKVRKPEPCRIGRPRTVSGYMTTLPTLELATVAERSTLEDAWRRVRAKAAGGGVDGETVGDFAKHERGNLNRLRRDLLRQRYVPDPTLEVQIPKESAPAERRRIGLASVRDKVVQEAVRSVLEPHAERVFLDCSYGYRPGRGPVRAIARLTHHVVLLKHRWIASGDVDDCFGSLDHARVIDDVRALGADDGILHLVSLWLQMGVVDAHGRWRDVKTGVTQGSIISPLLANLYLHAFDQAMVARGHALVRYADDFVVTAAKRTGAEQGLADAQVCLGDLGLRLNEDPSPVAAVGDGVPFLGIVVTPEGRTIAPKKLERLRGRLSRIASHADRDLEAALDRLTEVVTGLRRYYGVVLAGDALMPLDSLVRETLLQLVRQRFGAGAFKSKRAAHQALLAVGTVTDRSEAERRRWVERLVSEATGRDAGVTNPEAAGRRRGDADGTEASAPPHPAGAVRRRKHRHQREQARRRELVVDTPGSFLGKAGQRIVVRRDRRTVAELPLLQLAAVTVASRGVTLSTDLVTLCASRGIPIQFVSGDGRPTALLTAPVESRGQTALLQVRALEDETAAIGLARRFVEGKIRNQASVVKRLRKSRPGDEALVRCIETVDVLRRELDPAGLGADLPTARGRLLSVEGRAAQGYWSAIQAVLPDTVGFAGRCRQGATDLVNCLLNYGYGVLHRAVHLAILKAGLNPAISFLHSLQPHKPTLVFDLMEEFRAPIVDRAVVTLINRREPATLDDEAGRLAQDTRRRLLQRLQERLTSLVPYRGGEVTLEQVVARQAAAIVAHLEGRRAYVPFLARW